MSNSNDRDLASRFTALLTSLQQAVSDKVRLRALVSQSNFARVMASVSKALRIRRTANDHLTEDQIANAVKVCDDLVVTYISGEDPRSVSWESLDRCNALARKVIGQERVHELYRLYRPERLEDYIQDEAAGFPAVR